MTKAKDNNDRPLAETARARIEKALKLLDKVERGGVDLREGLGDYKSEFPYDAGCIHTIRDIHDKYILIERE
jgi:hypothetical protein